MRARFLIFTTMAVGLAGCATSEVVTVEHPKGLTVIHHKSHVGNQTVDKMEAIAKDGHVRTFELRTSDDSVNGPQREPFTQPDKAKSVRDALAAAKARQVQLKAKLAEAKANSDEALQGQLQATLSENEKLQAQLDAAFHTSKPGEAP